MSLERPHIATRRYLRVLVNSLWRSCFDIVPSAGAGTWRGCGFQSRSFSRTCPRLASFFTRNLNGRGSPCRPWSGASRQTDILVAEYRCLHGLGPALDRTPLPHRPLAHRGRRCFSSAQGPGASGKDAPASSVGGSVAPMFWERLKHRTQMFLKGSNFNRKWKFDDLLALFSWIFVGNAFLILAGTTTFVSIVVWLANSLQFQEYFARALSTYIKGLVGANITFESAIVPRWREGVIRLRNVNVIRNRDVRKEEMMRELAVSSLMDDEVDSNFTMYEFNASEVDVTLSFWRALEGKGIVKNCAMKGVRGVVDRRTVDWSQFSWDPVSSLLSPSFRPYTISVFSADLPVFRQEWMLYDILAADSVVGMFDNCLFSIHKISDPMEAATARWLLPPNGPWRDLPTGADTADEDGSTILSSLHVPIDWKSSKISRLRVDGVPIDFFNHGAVGPFGWITSGTLDMDVKIQMPRVAARFTGGDDVVARVAAQLGAVRSSGIDKVAEVVSMRSYERTFAEELHRKQHAPTRPRPGTPVAAPDDSGQHEPAQVPGPTDGVGMMVDVRLNNLKANVPIATEHMSYLANAMIRPLVAYMNANRTSIPLRFTSFIPMGQLRGSWTIYDCQLIEEFSDGVGEALTKLVQDERERARRLKRVGLWSIRSMARGARTLYEHLKVIVKVVVAERRASNATQRGSAVTPEIRSRRFFSELSRVYLSESKCVPFRNRKVYSRGQSPLQSGAGYLSGKLPNTTSSRSPHTNYIVFA
ncbi:mitochondrial distribution and morphology protein-domain-containing protein [Hyaloraphidium curvatum]|nr:mitochondrial distribution and morphology protein-domain-containing protein [Hyaloraphidium curvatum]